MRQTQSYIQDCQCVHLVCPEWNSPLIVFCYQGFQYPLHALRAIPVQVETVSGVELCLDVAVFDQCMEGWPEMHTLLFETE